MSTYLLDSLRRSVREKKAMVVVGAGISMSATNSARCASWSGLLEAGINRCLELSLGSENWAEERRYQLLEKTSSELFLAIADDVSTKLHAPNHGEFKRWLRETVGSLSIEKADIITALKSLQLPIVTTNYDSLIATGLNLKAISWKQSNEVSRFLRGDSQAVFHVHGYWENSESIILGSKSYERIVSHSHAQATLRAIASTHSLIFVGYGEGLMDPNFRQFIEWISETLFESEHRHYRLDLRKNLPEERSLDNAEGCLVPIAYGDNYSDLPGFLNGLIVEEEKKVYVPMWQLIEEKASKMLYRSPEKAVEIYEKGLDEDPDSVELLIHCANVLSEYSLKNSNSKAKLYYEKAISIDPSSSIAYGNYALFLANNIKDFKMARQMYDEAIRLSPDNHIILNNYISFLLENEEYEEADKFCRYVLEIKPDYSPALANYAILLTLEPNLIEKAEEHYLNAIEKSPDLPYLYTNYAIFLTHRKKDLSLARDYYKKAMAVDPDNANTIAGYALFSQNELSCFGEAKSLYIEALNKEPNNLFALTNYAKLLYEVENNVEEAKKYFERAVHIAFVSNSTSSSNLFDSYANFLVKEERNYIKAEEFFKKAIIHTPGIHTNQDDLSIYLTNYAVFLQENKKDFEQAENIYERAIRIKGNEPHVLTNYGVFLMEIKSDFEKAEELFKRSLSLNPSAFYSHSAYMLLLIRRHGYNSDRTSEIERTFQNACRIGSKDKKLLANLYVNFAGFCSDYLGERSLASFYLREAIRIDENFFTLGNYARFLSNDVNTYSDAMYFYDLAIKSNPDDLKLLIDFICLLEMTGLNSQMLTDCWARLAIAIKRG